MTPSSEAAPAERPQLADPVNLLTNGDFENDLTGWSAGSGIQIVSDSHGGTKAARLTSSTNLVRSLSGSVGRTYKVTLWIKINPSTDCSGDCWGSFLPRIENWSGVDARTDMLTPNSRPVGVWFKEAFTFRVGGPGTGGELRIGPFAGAGWTWDVLVDDVMDFEVLPTPQPPTATIAADRTTVSSLPGVVQFTSNADDSDGSVAYFFWDFGDGGKSNEIYPTHTYIGNGTYAVRLVVYDDDGNSASDELTVTVTDPTYPSLSVTVPATSPFTTSTPTVAIQGTASGGSAIQRVEWSTGRGLFGTASGTSNWSFTLDLSASGGPNLVLVNAVDSSGRSARKDLVIDYRPAVKVGIVNGSGGITQNASVVDQYEKFEATFQVTNSVASKPYLPYDTQVPAGMPSGAGITVDGLFTSPSGKTYRQPGFLFQPYAWNAATDQLLPSGEAVWKIRFAPQELGSWTYSISLTDASGSTTVSDSSRLKFSVVSPTDPDNHGFIRVSRDDWRYFEWSDGTPFVGVGPSVHVEGTPEDIDQQLNQIGEQGANLSRTWMSAHNIGGSSWGAWTGGIDYEGNYPGTSLTTDEAYGEGIFSFTLPQTNGSGKRCSFYGFQGTDASVKPNTNYRIFVRLKAVGITGSGGFTFRPGVGWPDSCDQFAGSPTPIAQVRGTKDWHVVTGTWNSGSRTRLGNALITLENVTAGRVFIDEISMREDLGGGLLGPEVLPRSQFNVQTYFSQEPSWIWDYALDAQASLGIVQKVVIEEKGDYSFNHISPYGFGYDKGEQMQIIGGASHRYEQYYWRYLTARFGYSRAVHSWEYANEQDPGNLKMANELAGYIHAIDPQQHLATTSFWCCLAGWDDSRYPNVDYADAHAYVTAYYDDTSWIGQTDPFTGGSIPQDTSLYVTAHSLDAWQKNASGNKPIIMGEAGVGSGGVVAGSNDNDPQGVWLHQFLWAQVNPGGMYFIYWYQDTIRSRDLYPLFQTYRRFMEGTPADTVNKRIPLSMGTYQDIQPTLPSGVYGWGQKDTTNGGAHFWMYDRAYKWTSPGGGSSLAGKSVSFGGLPAKTYTIEWWNTWSGQIVAEERQHGGGLMTLAVPSGMNVKDVAVKIYPKATGYPGPVPPPTPTFADVPFEHPYHDDIEILYQNGYTAGCGIDPLRYCPEQTMNRAESSVFVERGIHSATYSPPTPSSQIFADLALDSWAAAWVNGLWEDGYTAGCGTDPLIYCPWQGHTRAEGAVFYMRMLNGSDFDPPQPTETLFADVALETWYARWVHAAYAAGLIEACQTSPDLRYCPEGPLTRAVAAYMMVQAKGLNPPMTVP